MANFWDQVMWRGDQQGAPGAGNGQWAPQSGNAAQIFQDMLGANQGIPNMLMSNLMSGYNNAGQIGQNAQNAFQQTNAGNQGAAMGLQGMQANLDQQRFGNQANMEMQRRSQEAGLAKTALMRPLLAALIGNVGGVGAGGLLGAQSTNSPQSALLPGALPGATGAGGLTSSQTNANNALNANWLQPFQQLSSAFPQQGPHAMDFLMPGSQDWQMSPQDLARRNQMQNYNASLQHVNGQTPGVIGPNVLS